MREYLAETTQSLLECAHRGTMFLRNAAEMSRATQERLLKFLDDGEVASTSDGLTKVDVRIMTAVDMNLHSEVIAGRFSEPLYYRLNTIHIVVPPLRPQAEDSTECLKSSRRC